MGEGGEAALSHVSRDYAFHSLFAWCEFEEFKPSKRSMITLSTSQPGINISVIRYITIQASFSDPARSSSSTKLQFSPVNEIFLLFIFQQFLFAPDFCKHYIVGPWKSLSLFTLLQVLTRVA